MATTIERIVRADVSKTSASVSRQGFGIGLGVHQVEDTVQPSRYQRYGDTQEMLDAGFTNEDSAYKWAQTVFAQESRPSLIAIGRREPGVKKVYDFEITAAEVGMWVLTITVAALSYTKVYSYLADGDDDEVSIAEGFRLQIYQDETAIIAVSSLAQTTAVLELVAGIGGTDYTAVATPPGAGTATTTITTPSSPPEDITDCLNAINNENSKDWYLYTIDTRTDSDVQDAAVWGGGNLYTKYFIGQTASPDMKTGTTPNIGSDLGGLAFDNVYLVWNDKNLVYEDAAVLAIAASAQLDSENGQITWFGKQYKNVGFTDLKSGEIETIIANNGNVHVEVAGRGVSMDGKCVSGEFADVQVTIDWAKARTQEAVFTAIATTPTKVPGTNAGIAQVTAPFLGVLLAGVTNGHFSGDDPELPRVRAPKSSERSLQDRQDRVLRNVIGEAILSGAIHKVLLQLRVSV